MKNKLVFASGMALGYVFGAKAGRSSYEQLKAKADELWNNPKVQETVSETTEAIKHKAPEVQEQAKKAKESVSKAMHRSGKDDGSGKEARATSAEVKSTGAGPSGGNPAEVEDPPFQNQSPETRPST